MIALFIISAIVLTVLLVMMLNCGLRIQYQNEDWVVRLTIGGIPVLRYPKKPKKIKISDYTPRKIKKRREKLKRRQERLKKKKKEKPTSSGSKRKKSKKEPSLLEKLGSLRQLLFPLAQHGIKRVRLVANRIRIVVSSDDAAKTAILYGAVTAAASSLFEFLNQFKKVDRSQKSELSVIADFTAGECSVDIDILLSLRLWQLIEILLKAFIAYAKSKELTEEDTEKSPTQKNNVI